MGTSLKRRAQIIVEASKDNEVTEETPIDFKEVFDRQKEKMEVRMADTKKDCILYNNTKDSHIDERKEKEVEQEQCADTECLYHKGNDVCPAKEGCAGYERSNDI